MGCTSSKKGRLGQLGVPYARSSSMPVGRQGKCRVGDGGYDFISLIPSSLRALLIDTNPDNEESTESFNENSSEKSRDEFTTTTKAWSEMMERRLPKTPPCEEKPETINAWELMAGLEDESPSPPPPRRLILAPIERSSSFHTTRNPMPSKPLPKSRFANANANGNFQGDTILSSCNDVKVAAASNGAYEDGVMPFVSVKERISAFQEKINARKALSNGGKKFVPTHKSPPGGGGRVVLYFTSLRGVRETYEDCWAARMILKGYGVRVDERDVLMHNGFKEELNEILGSGYGGQKLPRLFVNGRHIGGVEDIRQMHESGELGIALKGCEMASSGMDCGKGVCKRCGDVRFVPCETCSGSCKIFVEELFKRCPDCNEYGLFRCPLCF